MRALLVLALAGCEDHATRSVRNAPGIVDLHAPLPHENGDPQRFEAAADPGFETLSIWTNPYLIWGHGRVNADGASREAGLEVHVEHAADGRLDLSAFGVTAGFGAQWGPGRTTNVGALYAELEHRFAYRDAWYFDLGLGPALYTEGREAGGQLSLRMPLGLFRVRYMARSGTEVMAGLELPFPFFFSRSK